MFDQMISHNYSSKFVSASLQSRSNFLFRKYFVYHGELDLPLQNLIQELTPSGWTVC